MAFKIIIILIILIISIQLYVNYKNKENSFVFMIASSLITTIICNLFLPSDISIFNILNIELESVDSIVKTDETYNDEQTSKKSDGSWISLAMKRKKLEEVTVQHDQAMIEFELMNTYYELEEIRKQINSDILNNNMTLNEFISQ